MSGTNEVSYASPLALSFEELVHQQEGKMNEKPVTRRSVVESDDSVPHARVTLPPSASRRIEHLHGGYSKRRPPVSTPTSKERRKPNVQKRNAPVKNTIQVEPPKSPVVKKKKVVAKKKENTEEPSLLLDLLSRKNAVLEFLSRRHEDTVEFLRKELNTERENSRRLARNAEMLKRKMESLAPDTELLREQKDLWATTVANTVNDLGRILCVEDKEYDALGRSDLHHDLDGVLAQRVKLVEDARKEDQNRIEKYEYEIEQERKKLEDEDSSNRRLREDVDRINMEMSEVNRSMRLQQENLFHVSEEKSKIEEDHMKLKEEHDHFREMYSSLEREMLELQTEVSRERERENVYMRSQERSEEITSENEELKSRTVGLQQSNRLLGEQNAQLRKMNDKYFSILKALQRAEEEKLTKERTIRQLRDQNQKLIRKVRLLEHGDSDRT